ncbi:DUF4328 domain-containing protein [Streptomyces sp. TRM66268-LWL]|uniref:DUF4328 domain-containing protein n=1 Tax=Streptomyces polyasparticus TaxID=2767826 RepID=A0ABR7SNU8_9ACTN|nr:DUF4328 domain-containing protein [Streptomyces polyasparticus]MBC9717171.1 DUF4328 domain-containing protein [Streptomyces polyasparticus]
MPAYSSVPVPVPVVPGVYLKSPVGLSKALMILLGVVGLTDLFAVFTGFNSLGVVNRLKDDPFTVPDADIESADVLYGAAGIGQTAAMVAAIVLFLCWFWRTRTNAEVFEPAGHARSRGWAIGGWFIPFGCFWIPRGIAGDIWRASAVDEQSRKEKLLNMWWGLWVATTALGWIASRQYARAESLDAVHSALVSVLVTDALDIAAVIAAILFVRRLTAMQTAKALAGPSTPPFVPNLPAL